MQKENSGATSADWAHFALMLGLTADLLPVVSNPSATIAPDSTVKELGKTPSQYGGGNLVWGMKGWTGKVTTAAEVARWSKKPDYGICLQSRNVRALDIDITDPAQAKEVHDFILARITLPERFRADSSKHLFAVRVEGNFAKRAFKTSGGKIEFLATGQQFIVAGRHPNGARYEWRGGLPDEIPEMSADAFEELWDDLARLFALEKVAKTSDRAPVEEISDLDAAVAAQPLDLSNEQIEAYLTAYPAAGLEYGEWLGVGMALHHQFAGSLEGFALWLGWSALDEARYDPDVTEAKWASFEVGSKPVTMATVIHKVKESGVVVSTRKTWLDRIEECDDKHFLEALVMQKIAKDKTIGIVDLADIKAAVKAKFNALGVKMLAEPLNKMFKPVVKRMLPDIGSNELPLETIDNLEAVCNNNNVQVRYNVIKKDDEILIADAKWSVDNAKSASITWLRSACHKVEMRTTNIKNFVTLLADKNQFNPVVEWVTSEPWDGVSRLEEFYATVRENPDECSEKMKRTVMLRWMVGAIAAAFSPSGVMVRGVLVFQGEQYTGKTRWIDALAPKEKELVKTGRSLLVHDKDSVKQILSCWISELGELDATFKKSDIAALKAFITSDMDEMRRPYAIAESQYVRRTVFAASVNEPKFLQDDTGNSRFWVLPILSVDHAHTLDMQQVWAEIHALWDEGRGEKHYLSKEEMDLLNCHNETFTAPDPIFEMIRGHLDWDNFSLDTCEWKQVSDVLRWLGHNNPSKYDTILAGKAIKKLNYGHHRRPNGVRLVAVPSCKISQVEGELTF